jgi:lipopolysaccharide transport system ATP-binding protein
MDDILIDVEDVSKIFCRSLKRSIWYGVRDIASELVGKRRDRSELRTNEFWANRDISFQVRRGECLGLIGRNGAGKTTLLKMLNGLIKPDRGRITMRGRIGALIALGAGFNPILTGRENIYINGSVLGLSKREIDRKVDEIIEFADVRDAIDAPVRTYSSGMMVRLGFAVATAITKPDILILDEVLAVGDAQFRYKCYNRVGQLKRNTAVIFVSHSMANIGAICDRTLVLDKGRIEHFGNTAEGIKRYLEIARTSSARDEAEAFEIFEHPVTRFRLGLSSECVQFGGEIRLEAEIELSEPSPSSLLRIAVYDETGLVVAEWHSKRSGAPIDLESGTNHLEIPLGPVLLKNGRYFFGFFLNDHTSLKVPVWSYKAHEFVVEGPEFGEWTYQFPIHQTVNRHGDKAADSVPKRATCELRV